MRYCDRILRCRALEIDISVVTSQNLPIQINKTQFDSRASDVNASVHFTRFEVINAFVWSYQSAENGYPVRYDLSPLIFALYLGQL